MNDTVWKLEENENATKVRLLKVKEMVLQDAHNYGQKLPDNDIIKTDSDGHC